MNKQIRTALLTYAEHHHAAGAFVMSCVANDLMEAVTRADMFNVQDLPEIMRFIFNELPAGCWGSTKKVEEWLEAKGPTRLPDLNREAWRDYE